MTKNIRNAADRAALATKGYAWVTVSPRGESKGAILSAHKTYVAAEKAAKGRDRDIIQVTMGEIY